jgi:hypothetical protein
MNSEQVLSERGMTHGKFSDNARNGQALRDLFRQSPHWADMDPVCREALDMMACKISRILSGQATFADHWLDIEGYSALARRVCER